MVYSDKRFLTFMCIVGLSFSGMNFAVENDTYDLLQKSRDVYYVFLAGGNGERLWPLSNDLTPKQLLPLGPEGTLLAQTIDRVAPMTDKKHAWISTTEKHAAQIRSVVGDKVDTILIEPGSRNTGPAILYCCMKIHAINPDATIVFLPADAFIPKSEWVRFREFLATSIDYAAMHEDIVLLGMEPTHPATGYGYIEFAAQDALSKEAPYHVTHFREKPSLEVAQQYMQEGNKLWNIGIFVGRAALFMQEYAKAVPDMYQAMEGYLNGLNSYNDVPKDSIDYAVMERSKNISVLPVNFAWCDVGNIDVFLTLKQQYSTLNANFVSIDAKNNLIDVPGKTVALVGVHDLCIVEVEGALLITKREQAEKVRGIVDLLRQNQISAR